jgi:hypothetical protein
MLSFNVIFPDIDGHKEFAMPRKQPSQHFPAEYRYSPLKTTTREIGSRSSPGVLESDIIEEDLIITQMANDRRQAKVELAKLVSWLSSVFYSTMSITIISAGT